MRILIGPCWPYSGKKYQVWNGTTCVFETNSKKDADDYILRPSMHLLQQIERGNKTMTKLQRAVYDYERAISREGPEAGRVMLDRWRAELENNPNDPIANIMVTVYG